MIYFVNLRADALALLKNFRQPSIDIINKIILHSVIRGEDLNLLHVQCVIFQLKESQKVVMFKFQFWDCGEHAIRKYDHLLPVSR